MSLLTDWRITKGYYLVHKEYSRAVELWVAVVVFNVLGVVSIAVNGVVELEEGLDGGLVDVEGVP